MTISKHSEAIREGVEDYEYLNELRRLLGDAASQDATAAVLQAPSATDTQWVSPKDRSTAGDDRLIVRSYALVIRAARL